MQLDRGGKNLEINVSGRSKIDNRSTKHPDVYELFYRKLDNNVIGMHGDLLGTQKDWTLRPMAQNELK